MKILITGSHFTPAQAVIEKLKKKQDIQIVYVGRTHTQEGYKTPSAESLVIPPLGVKFVPIVTGRLQRSITLHTIPSLLKIPIGFFHALCILIKERPNVVVSFGGYIAVPVVLSAWLLSIPIIIHEQTLVRGLANRISGSFATKIAITFAKLQDFPKEKTIVVGNPVREKILHPLVVKDKEIDNILREVKRNDLPLLLILGGNQGSHMINKLILSGLEELLQIACIVHQTGDSKFGDFDKLVKVKNNSKYPERYLIKKWIDVEKLGYLYKNTDLAVSRGGINTLLELAYIGIPTLVIPIPYLYKDEQTVNAKYFENLRLVTLLPQNQATTHSLLRNLNSMVKGLDFLKQEAAKAKQSVITDAAEKLALEAVLLANE